MSNKKPPNHLKNNSSCSSNSSDDSDSNHSNDELDQQAVISRKKREIDGSAPYTELNKTTVNHPSTSSNHPRTVVWPPISNAATSNIRYVPWPIKRPSQINLGNPDYGTKMQLFSKTDYFLAINADGTVNGTRDKSDLHTKIQLINLGKPGLVRIQGLLTELYLALDDRGRPFAHYNIQDPNTEWQEVLVGNYKSYQNVYMLKMTKRAKRWFLGIKKSGKGKNGIKTRAGQAATKFLTIRP